MDFAPSLRTVLPLLTLLLLAPLSLSARKPGTVEVAAVKSPLLSDAFRDAINRGVANGAYRTVAVGVIDGAARGTFYFGHRDDAKSPPADADSAFEIGAVSDVFTNLLLAQAAIDGRLHLSDPIGNFLPAGFPFGAARLAQMPIEALATQRSELPAIPSNLYPSNADDPYASYATEDLLAFLALFRQDAAPSDQTESAYSIINGGLLGQLLARIYASAFSDALSATVLLPMGMPHTSQRDEDLLTGYARGSPVPHSHYAALSGAAGLRSTLPDLLAFLQLNLTPGESPLRRALLLGRQPRAGREGAQQTVLGWNIRTVTAADKSGWPLVWRASEVAGFSVFLGFRADQQRAIVMLANTSEDLAVLGLAWLEEAPLPPPAHGYATPRDIDLAAYPGLYQIEADSEVVVRADNGSLSLQLPGSMPQRLQAVDKDVFVSDVAGISVTFMRNIDVINGLVLHLNGSHLSASRLSDRAPRLRRIPIAAPKNVRESLIGDYRLDARTWMRVGLRGDALTVQLTMSSQRVVYAYAPDRYADLGGSVEVAFDRDADAHVVKATLTLGGVQRIATPLLRTTH